MATKMIEFGNAYNNTIVKIGKDEFVKTEFKNGYNAFNLDTGSPCFIYCRTMCEIKED